MHGWMGKILYINLTDYQIKIIDSRPYVEKYLGGRGVGLALYWENVKPETRAFDPENCLIFSVGPVVATRAQGATMTSVVGKSPATVPEGYCYGNLTGFVGPELKKAGYDGLLVTGQAKHPVYLLIEDDKIEIKDASSMWGINGYRTGALLEQAHGKKTRWIVIGAAGENLIKTALAMATHDCTVSAGFGAVMGSKNLKAIAIRGSGRVQVAHPKKLTELNRYTFKISKRIRLTHAPHIEGTKYADELEVIGKGGCYMCGLECVAGIYRYGKKHVGHRKCESVEYYLPWAYGKEEEPIETLFYAPVKANDYGFDSWEMNSICDWLYDCYKAGALTDEEAGLPLGELGTGDFLDKLMDAIAHRKGIGKILAEGLYRGSDQAPPKAKALLRRSVAPIGQNDIFSPRAYPIMALFYPLEPRVHHINYHDIAFVHIPWSHEQRQPGSTGVNNELIRRIAREIWNSEAAADFSGYEGQAMAAKTIQNRTYIKESLGLCDWAYPISYSFGTPDRFGDPELEAKLFSAITGVSGEALEETGERIYNLQRLILLREGRRTPEEDYPMPHNFTEPLESPAHTGILVPGPGDSVINTRGRILDREKYMNMLKEFYRIRGWDEETGLPLRDTLEKLGINGFASEYVR
ncbi:MAG: aldehyde ferredoxin oxidoreductase N-terminal domain-containing protein [Desulfobacteraceae bacterium]|jgi:aldehyde:ferredoxin oxidoreductase